VIRKSCELGTYCLIKTVFITVWIEYLKINVILPYMLDLLLLAPCPLHFFTPHINRNRSKLTILYIFKKPESIRTVKFCFNYTSIKLSIIIY